MSERKTIKVKLDERLFLEAVCGGPSHGMSIDALKQIIKGYEDGEALLQELEKCLKEGAGTMVVAYEDDEPVDAVPSCDEKGSVSFNDYWRLAQKLRERSMAKGESLGIQKEKNPQVDPLWKEAATLLKHSLTEDDIEHTGSLVGKIEKIVELNRQSRNNALQRGLAPQLVPIAEQGVGFSQSQSKKRSKRKTWHGKSAQEIKQRNAQIIEDYKKAKAKNPKVTPTGFALQKCEKYGLKPRRTREIIENNLPS